MGLFSSDTKENTLLIDISSSSVACALVHNKKGVEPEIDFALRESFQNIEGDQSENVEMRMLVVLRKILNTTFSKGQEIIKQKNRKGGVDVVIVGLSSLWYLSSLKTHEVGDKEGILLTTGAQRDILRSEQINFLEELKNVYKEESEIFESNIIGVSANGYRIENWTNKTATAFDITFLQAGAPKKLIRAIENEVIKTFGTKRGISVHSINSILSQLISHSYKNLHSAILVDISGDTTNILFIHDSVPEKVVLIPFGINSLVNKISENLTLPRVIAESMMSLYLKGDLKEESVKELDGVFLDARDEWDFNSIISKENSIYHSPQNIFLVSDTKYGEIGKTMLEDIFLDKEVIILDCKQGFIKECIKSDKENYLDGHLAILGTYSQFLY